MSMEEPTVICLIRHGETDWNASGRLQGCEDTELNDSGREQAVQLALYLKKEQWDTVISSPLKRALVSAEIIASHLSIGDVPIMDMLRERNYGQASGLLPEERRSRFPDGKFPGQEEFDDLRIRAINALNSLVRDYPGKRIIVVSHGAFINSILYYVSGGEFGSFKTRLKNACLNQLIFQNNRWTVSFYNKTAIELS